MPFRVNVGSNHDSVIQTQKSRRLKKPTGFLYTANLSDTLKIDLEIADKTRVQLMNTDPTVPATEIIAKTSERGSLYEALDVASIWLSKNN